MKIEGVFGGLFGSDSQRESGSQPAPRGGTIRAGRDVMVKLAIVFSISKEYILIILRVR